MRRLSIAVVAAASTAAFTQIASAADLPRKAPAEPPPPPAISWTGWYAGVNVGPTWGGDPVSTSASNIQFCGAGCGGGLEAALASAQGATGVFSANNSLGFMGGGQLGYNWQFNSSWVAGLEADIQAVSAAGSNSAAAVFALPSFPASNVATNLSVAKSINYLGTVRGRLGYLAMPSLLVYGTGGLAYGRVNSNTNISQTLTNFGGVALGLTDNSSVSNTRAGWTAGGGLEWMFAPRWSVKGEYLYYDLGRVTYNSQLVDPITVPGFIPPTYFINNVQATTRFNGNIARLGLSYHF